LIYELCGIIFIILKSYWIHPTFGKHITLELIALKFIIK
jgi:hypothetical protein